MEAKKFTNFSNESFSWKFGGVEYTFGVGQTMFLEDYKADHFAKHLIDRELNKAGLLTNNQSAREEMLAKCFPSDEVVSTLEALNIEETKKVSKKKAKVVEEEFADLADTK